MTGNDASISPDGRMRWWLRREIDSLPATGSVLFIMLNPSTADAQHDDPTIRKCVDYVKRWGMATLLVVNLFAWRATDPSELRAQSVYNDVVGMDLSPGGLARNDGMILNAALGAGLVVCAWGNDGEFMRRGADVTRLLEASGIKLTCLKVNKSGEPAHPLYLRHDLDLQPYGSTVRKVRRSAMGEAAA